MNSETDPTPDHVTEDDLRRVIRRAVQLDLARDDQIPIALLFEIAKELSISEASLRQALAEHFETIPIAVTPEPQPGELVAFAAKAVAPGFLLGALFSISANSLDLSPWPGLPIACMLGLAITAEKPHRQTTFQLRSLSMWLGIAFSWPQVVGYVPGDLVIVSAGYALFSSIVGGALVWLRNRFAKGIPPAIQQLGTGPGATAAEAIADADMSDRSTLRWRIKIVRLQNWSRYLSKVGEPATLQVASGQIRISAVLCDPVVQLT